MSKLFTIFAFFAFSLIWNNTQAQEYCTSQGNNTSDEFINNVTIGSIDNTSGNSGGYWDFTSISTNFNVGAAATINITPAWTGTVYNEGYSVWIDYNQDNDFDDAGEQVFSKAPSTSATATGSFTIPETATAGTTRMRVAMKYNAIPGPCETFTYGEVEDYTVNIIRAINYCLSEGSNTSDEFINNVTIGSINNISGDSDGYGDFTNLSTDLTQDETTTITITPTWTGVAFKEGYSVWIDYNQDNDFDDAGEQVFSKAPSTSATATGSFTIPETATTGTTRMRVAMKYNAIPGPCETFTYGEVEDYTVNITAAINYCLSEGSNTSDEFINNVTIGSINNTSGDSDGYGDFTNLSTDLTQDETTTITITPTWTGVAYNEGYSVWIDYNRDGDFSDAGERVFTKNKTFDSSVSGTFTIPTTATIGSTRMRVSMQYNAVPNACGSFTYGEVEDYTVNIVAGSLCAVPTGLAISEITSSSAIATWNVVPGAVSYDLRLTEVGTNDWATFSSPTDTIVGLFGLEPNTTYEFQVSINCGSESSDFLGITFTTPSNNPGLTNDNTEGTIAQMFYHNPIKGEEAANETADLEELNDIGIIEEEVEFDADMTLFPNPTNGPLNLRFQSELEGSSTILITDLLGKVIQMQTISVQAGANTFEWDFSHLPDGTYLLQMNVGKAITVERFIVTR